MHHLNKTEQRLLRYKWLTNLFLNDILLYLITVSHCSHCNNTPPKCFGNGLERAVDGGREEEEGEGEGGEEEYDMLME